MQKKKKKPQEENPDVGWEEHYFQSAGSQIGVGGEETRTREVQREVSGGKGKGVLAEEH